MFQKNQHTKIKHSCLSKKISGETDTKKIEKYKLKIAGYEQQILDLQNQKSGIETRGRKKKKLFELIIAYLV